MHHRTKSKAKAQALAAIQSSAKHAGGAKGVSAGTIAVAYALLEVAFQLGRIADNVPLYGPASEH
jgi:hypothetical protein